MSKLLLSISLGIGLVLTCTSYLFAKGGHDHSEAHIGEHWSSPKGEQSRKNPIKSTSESIKCGSNTYQLLCTSCHGATALGDGPMADQLEPKPTNLKAMSGGHSDGDFAWKIANGRGAMPAWKDVLKEEQIWDLVNFIQSLQNTSEANNKHDHSGHKH